MSNLNVLFRQGQRLLQSPSAYQKLAGFAPWRDAVKAATRNSDVRKKLRLVPESLQDDLRVLGEQTHQPVFRTEPTRQNQGTHKSHREKEKRRNHGVGKKKNVFVVIGRNKSIEKDMFTFLRALGLYPIEWSQAIRMTHKPNPFIGEILDAAFAKAQAVVVVFTGDDESRLRKHLHRKSEPAYEKQLYPQPRPNVILEAGMAFGRHPDRTIVVEIGKIRPISDFAGRYFTKMDGSVQTRKALVERLKQAKCAVDDSGDNWLEVGSFKEAT